MCTLRLFGTRFPSFESVRITCVKIIKQMQFSPDATQLFQLSSEKFESCKCMRTKGMQGQLRIPLNNSPMISSTTIKLTHCQRDVLSIEFSHPLIVMDVKSQRLPKDYPMLKMEANSCSPTTIHIHKTSLASLQM